MVLNTNNWEEDGSGNLTPGDGQSVSVDALRTATRIPDVVIWNDSGTYRAEGSNSEIASDTDIGSVLNSVDSNYASKGLTGIAPGTYNVDTDAVLGDGHSLKGSGFGTVLQANDASVTNILDLTSWKNATISGLDINGNNLATRCIDLQRSSSTVHFSDFYRVAIGESTGDGIRVGNCEDIYFRHCSFEACGTNTILRDSTNGLIYFDRCKWSRGGDASAGDGTQWLLCKQQEANVNHVRLDNCVFETESGSEPTDIIVLFESAGTLRAFFNSCWIVPSGDTAAVFGNTSNVTSHCELNHCFVRNKDNTSTKTPVIGAWDHLNISGGVYDHANSGQNVLEVDAAAGTVIVDGQADMREGGIANLTNATRGIHNGIGQEASSGTPTTANWEPGDFVEDTNNAGDVYLLLPDGSTWVQPTTTTA